MATTNFEKLIATYITQIQTLEQVFFQLLNERGLTTSQGVQIDGIGQIVGEERNVRNDTDYLRALEGKILINLSSGTLEELLAIILKLLPEPRDLLVVEDSFPAHFEIEVEDTVDILPAEITTGAAEPYALAAGLTLDVQVDGGGTQIVTFDAADFANITQATADELAAVLTSDIVGATAVRTVNRVALRSNVPGDPSSIEITGGTAATVLSFPSGLHTGPEANQALMVRIGRALATARCNSVRGILKWDVNNQSFGFLGTIGALGFTQGAFASASDGA